MSINTNINITEQTSKEVEINLVDAVQLVGAVERRLELHVELPLVLVTTKVVVAATEAEANSGCGKILEADTSGNTSIFEGNIEFTTNSAAQGEKWALIVVGPATLDLMINEFIAP